MSSPVFRCTSTHQTMTRFIPLLAFWSLSFTIHGQAEWQQMSSCPGAGRFWAAATGNSTVAIAGTGRLQFSGLNNTVADMWLYEAATDTWTPIPDYPGGVREGADAFTIGERLFVAFGSPFIQFTTDMYEFIPATLSWEQKPSVPGLGFGYSHGFVVGDTYYIGPENSTGLVYAFNADTETWTTVAPFPGQDRRAQCAFSANGKGYIGMGMFVLGGVLGDWWEYDPVADTWTQVASISPMSDQSTATAVNDRGYVFNVGQNQKNLYAYDEPTNDWLFQSTLPTERIANGTLFTIGSDGYLVFGEKTMSGGNNSSNELWRFTPSGVGVAERTKELGVTVLSLPDGGQEILSNEPLRLGGTWEVYDSQGRLLRQAVVAPNEQVHIVLNPEGGRGLRVVVIKSGLHTARVRTVVH